MTKYNVKISNKKLGIDLKNLFIQKEGIPSDQYKVRLLHKGTEILDKDSLSIFNFANHSQVQVACNKIELVMV